MPLINIIYICIYTSILYSSFLLAPRTPPPTILIPIYLRQKDSEVATMILATSTGQKDLNKGPLCESFPQV